MVVIVEQGGVVCVLEEACGMCGMWMKDYFFCLILVLNGSDYQVAFLHTESIKL